MASIKYQVTFPSPRPALARYEPVMKLAGGEAPGAGPLCGNAISGAKSDGQLNSGTSVSRNLTVFTVAACHRYRSAVVGFLGTYKFLSVVSSAYDMISCVQPVK